MAWVGQISSLVLVLLAAPPSAGTRPRHSSVILWVRQFAPPPTSDWHPIPGTRPMFWGGQIALEGNRNSAESLNRMDTD